MTLKGFPVVVVAEGGAPFVLVESGAPLATVAENGMGTPITPVTAHAPPLVLSNPILSIFADGTDGFYFDFSKTDRLFQNIIGTTPADDPNENIALALESHAWQGRTLAGVLASTPPTLFDDFSTYADTAALLAVWGFVPTGDGTLTLDSGKMALFRPTSDDGVRASRSFSTVAGEWYRWSFTVSGSTAARRVGSSLNGQNIIASGAAPVGVHNLFFQAISSTTYIQFNGQTVGTPQLIDDVVVEHVPGNHGLQATTAAQPKWQTGGIARFDGSDDNLLTTLVPGAANSLLAKVAVPASIAATQIVIGGNTSLTRLWLGFNTSGQLVAGVGTDGSTVIIGSTDLRGTVANIGLVQSNGGNIALYVGATAQYSAAQNGNAGTQPLRLGASNEAGAAGNFFDGDIYHALAIKKALTAAEIQAITNLWGTT